MNEINSTMGQPQKIGGFLDGKDRLIVPITMRNFTKLIDSLQYINLEKMWTNFAWEDGEKAIMEVFDMSFPTENAEDLMDNINAGNFSKIMNTILDINGIDFSQSKAGEEEKNEIEV